MANAREIRARQERLKATQPASSTPAQQDPRTHRASANVIPVVIRSTQTELLASEPIRVQQVRYTTTPPSEGSFEGVGPYRTAYPYWGLLTYHYAAFAWGPDDPLTRLAWVFLAMEDRGSLVLVQPLKVLGAVLDPNQAVSGCSFG